MRFINCVPLPLFFVLLCVSAKSILVERYAYIVHMDNTLMPKAFSSHHHWYSSIIDSFNFANLVSLDTNQSSPLLLYNYDNAFHGFSAILSMDELETLKKSQGFILAYGDHTITLSTTHTPEFLSLNASIGQWPTTNYGKDIIIGIIDSGIWPKNPSFKDDGMNTKNPAKWKG